MILINNPYSALINHMREQGGKNNNPYVEIGLIVAENPLTISVGDLQIGKENLLVAVGLTFHAGDIIALIPTLDRQTYIVLTKVINP